MKEMNHYEAVNLAEDSYEFSDLKEPNSNFLIAFYALLG